MRLTSPHFVAETTIALHSSDALWPGTYELELEVKDAQGLGCPNHEVFTVDVCTCVGKEDCRKTLRYRSDQTSSGFTSRAIGPLIGAFCLLMREFTSGKYTKHLSLMLSTLYSTRQSRINIRKAAATYRYYLIFILKPEMFKIGVSKFIETLWKMVGNTIISHIH